MKILQILLITTFLSCSAQEKDFTKKIEKITENNKETKLLYNGWYHISKEKNEFERVDRKTGIKYFINPNPILIPENFKSNEEFKKYDEEKGISVLFDNYGTLNWSTATEQAIGYKLIFILNNQILSSPTVNSQITGGICAFWKNEHTEKEWNELKNILN